MSKIFKRPMFRKGGNVGTGIMTGITDRVEAQNGFFGTAPNPLDVPKTTSDPFQGLDFNFQTPKVTIPEARELSDIIGEREKALMGATEYKSTDPLTKFLLTFGPAYAGETRGRGAIGRALTASQEPIKEMLKDKQREADFKRAVRLKAVESGISTKEALDKEIREAKNLQDKAVTDINNAVKSARNKIISDANLSEQEQKDALERLDAQFKARIEEIKLQNKLTNEAVDKLDFDKIFDSNSKVYLNAQTAKNATNFDIDDYKKFREKVGGSMDGGKLQVDISQLDKGEAKKQLKNLKNKFVYDPFDDNYKFIKFNKNTKEYETKTFNTIDEIDVDSATKKTGEDGGEEKKEKKIRPDNPYSAFPGTIKAEEERKKRFKDQAESFTNLGAGANAFDIGDI